MSFETEYSECVWCLNVGYAIVPHLRDVSHGDWSGWHTFAVYCKCRAGRIESERHTDRRSMSLDEYEQHNPTWREQLRAKAAADKARRES